MAVKRTFTLLEIVLALAIFSVIATLAGSILFSSQQGWSVVRESSAELETLQRLDRIADTAFRNAIPFHWPDENNRNVQLFRGKPAFLRLAYLHRVNDPAEGGNSAGRRRSWLRVTAVIRSSPTMTESAGAR